MAKYVVLKRFRDKETKEVYEEGQEVELTVKRADEAIKNLDKHKGEFLERIDNKKDEVPEEVVQEVEQEDAGVEEGQEG